MDALTEAVCHGRLKGLVALRDVLAAEIVTCDSKRDLAALSQRLMDILAQIETAEKALPAEKGTALDELRQRRAQRETSGSARPAKRKQRGG